MSKCIGGIVHDAVGALVTHQPSKTYDSWFEEKKAPLEALQAGLARAVLPKTPPMPAVTDTKRPLLIPKTTKRDYLIIICQKNHLKNNQCGQGCKKNTEKSMKSRSPMGCLLIYVG